MQSVTRFTALLIALFISTTSVAFAHADTGTGGGFIQGFMHPLGGLDHIAAMVAVGLWGAFLGRPAIWLLPVVFPLVMTFGGAMGIVGIPVPAVETGIAVSAIVLGLMVALAARPPLWMAAVLVGIFAIFHGYAHGAELPQAANALAYSMGFVVATGLLHLSGIAVGLLVQWSAGNVAVRAGGVVISLIGVGFLVGVL
jgi:urease accessory protein